MMSFKQTFIYSSMSPTQSLLFLCLASVSLLIRPPSRYRSPSRSPSRSRSRSEVGDASKESDLIIAVQTNHSIEYNGLKPIMHHPIQSLYVHNFKKYYLCMLCMCIYVWNGRINQREYVYILCGDCGCGERCLESGLSSTGSSLKSACWFGGLCRTPSRDLALALELEGAFAAGEDVVGGDNDDDDDDDDGGGGGGERCGCAVSGKAHRGRNKYSVSFMRHTVHTQSQSQSQRSLSCTKASIETFIAADEVRAARGIGGPRWVSGAPFIHEEFITIRINMNVLHQVYCVESNLACPLYSTAGGAASTECGEEMRYFLSENSIPFMRYLFQFPRLLNSLTMPGESCLQEITVKPSQINM